MDYQLIIKVAPFFAKAAWSTVVVSFLSFALGLSIAFPAAFCRLSQNRFLQIPARVYVSVFRGTPCLIQLFVIYFGGPQIGIQLEPFMAGVLGLGINIGSYMTESIRGAILAVSRGQTEASRSLGLNKFQTMRKVVLPQAAGLMISPLGVNTIALIKGSSLVSAISVLELAYTAHRFTNSTYRPFEMFILASTFYLVIITLTSKAIRNLNGRFAYEK
ncbi:MAG: amino acid ABC transporter permease [Deltaproteobacteria bacterium]|nr:amino acid ABC transporter permease [Deltaproteobacteria bacterium]MBW2041113.1 amino acid ABC transporter permease [Deltaproteobacteria bacterium]MBW2132261.1 amino acid ABC transporter permease [Deltaproteobacteria bacterium]